HHGQLTIQNPQRSQHNPDSARHMFLDRVLPSLVDFLGEHYATDRVPWQRPKSVVSVVSPQVSVALGLLILTAGVASLSVGYSTPHKIESFGEGDLFFVDTQAINFNRGLHQSRAAGIGLSCLGVALAAMGLAVWVLPRADWKTRLFHRAESGEGRGEWAPKWMGFSDGGDVVTKPPVLDEKKVPVTLSKVENVQPAS
uniref:Neurensin 1-like n=1 Tax=Periophthalmus magnuspinnatus TaxID=409849 RepID=A0A3B4AIB4_9GOBI